MRAWPCWRAGSFPRAYRIIHPVAQQRRIEHVIPSYTRCGFAVKWGIQLDGPCAGTRAWSEDVSPLARLGGKLSEVDRGAALGGGRSRSVTGDSVGGVASELVISRSA
jgi:hypothetical protein